ncbi:MAG: polysaccharide export protein [Beijerinckiaceae bacterium]|nr:polysaccharide export protein [Beijerinckiaceae bacterium]MDO9441129.1 polysaccharide biosynthesis/export family protein [Beijerinckiaceae bacterium]
MRYPILSLLLAALTLSGCAGQGHQASYIAQQADAPYTLASGDRLRVIVYGQDSLSNSYNVDGTGRISMPLIGFVEAQGMTVAQVERTIESRLRNGFLRDPKVAAEVISYRPFFILGEVTTAGQYPYISGMTVQNAIAVAGGFTPRAAKSTVDLTRVVRGQSLTASVPVTEKIRPGDTVTIRERFF